MITRVSAVSLSVLVLVVRVSQPVCVNVEPQPQTEAVLGSPMKLMCISCLKREELVPTTLVDWYYVPPQQEPIRIFLYDGGPRGLEGPWQGRLAWSGSKDLQDVSISILNVTLNDSGLYHCNVSRQFDFQSYRPFSNNTRQINLVVREEAAPDPTAVYSEIMMYVLLVFLTSWLLVEMVYCYSKISRADELPQDNAY